MTTTSAADLLAHASILTRQLRDSEAPITGPQWATFDVTVHRLMLELIGGGALYTQGRTNRPSAPALAVFRSYPEPLRYPVDTQLSAKEAAVLASRRPEYFRRKIQHGNLHAVRDGGAYLINTRDLDQNHDIAPADYSDPHPLARISCTLGAMADLAFLVVHRLSGMRFFDRRRKRRHQGERDYTAEARCRGDNGRRFGSDQGGAMLTTGEQRCQ